MLIVGGGPTGLAAALQCERAGVDWHLIADLIRYESHTSNASISRNEACLGGPPFPPAKWPRYGSPHQGSGKKRGRTGIGTEIPLRLIY